MKVVVHSSGRQDWGILHSVCSAIAAKPGLKLAVVAGGMHSRDGQRPDQLGGFAIDANLDDLPEGDDDQAVARAAARTAAALAEVLPRLGAECLLLAGDRSETLAAAMAATCLRLPVCHLHGGETTLGAIDDACRHAITRLASLHAVAHPSYAERLRHWDIPAERIVVSGAPALDELLSCTLPTRNELAAHLGRDLGLPTILLAHHPATLGMDPAAEIRAVLAGLADALAVSPQALVIASRPNVDAGGGAIANVLATAAQADPRILLTADLGSRRWWGLMAHASLILGNSSSALLEAPSFGLPAINVGDRQRGRLHLDNVIHCPPERTAVARAVATVLAHPAQLPRLHQATDFGSGQAGTVIAAALADLARLEPDARLARMTP